MYHKHSLERENMKKLTKLALVLVFSVLLTGCMHQAATTDDATMESETVIENDVMEGEAAAGEAAEGEAMEGDAMMVDLTSEQTSEASVSFNASNFTFGTEEVRVKKGTDLTFLVTNDSGFHDLLIDELDVNTGIIPEGETVEVSIPTDTAGEYEFYCSVGNHRAMGMKGTLIIEE